MTRISYFRSRWTPLAKCTYNHYDHTRTALNTCYFRFVCAASKQTGDTVCLTTYPSPRGGIHLFNSTKVWEACRATSAATSFFDPVTIGPYDEEFVDGALGSNNPVYALWVQAQDLWGTERLQQDLGCLVSIRDWQIGPRPIYR